jgi:PhnB protein
MAEQSAAKSAEAQVRSLVDAWAQALRDKDPVEVIARQAQDVIQFDFAPPLQTVGADLQGLRDWFATWQGPIGFEVTNLRVVAGEDVAFCHALVHLTGTRTDGSASDVWYRHTLCLRKLGDEWKIAHGHESVPMRMDGSLRAAVDLRP